MGPRVQFFYHLASCAKTGQFSPFFSSTPLKEKKSMLARQQSVIQFDHRWKLVYQGTCLISVQTYLQNKKEPLINWQMFQFIFNCISLNMIVSHANVACLVFFLSLLLGLLLLLWKCFAKSFSHVALNVCMWLVIQSILVHDFYSDFLLLVSYVFRLNVSFTFINWHVLCSKIIISLWHWYI